MDDDAALVVADADAVAVGDAELGQRIGMNQRGRPPSRAKPAGVLLKLVLRNERDGAGTIRNGRAGSPSSMTATWSGNAGSRA